MGVQIAFDFLSQSPPCGGPTLGASTAKPSHLELTSPEGACAARAASAAVPTDVVPAQVATRAALEDVLRKLTGLQVALHLTDNERTMISTRQRDGLLTVRLHHMFLQADSQTLASLAGYLDKSDQDAGAKLGTYIARHRSRIRRAAPRRVVLRSAGCHHDLQRIFDDLNHRYFAGAIAARVTWSRRTTVQGRAGEQGGRIRRSIKLGSYRGKDALIRVHPALDAAWVPEYFVSYIVYHEMLHQAVPPVERATRRGYHCQEFRERERQFSGYKEAILWERRNLHRLLQV